METIGLNRQAIGEVSTIGEAPYKSQVGEIVKTGGRSVNARKPVRNPRRQRFGAIVKRRTSAGVRSDG